MRSFYVVNNEVAFLVVGERDKPESTAYYAYGKDEVNRIANEQQLPLDQAEAWAAEMAKTTLPEKAERPTEMFSGAYVTDVVTKFAASDIPDEIFFNDDLASPIGHVAIDAPDMGAASGEITVAFYENNEYVLVVARSKAQVEETMKASPNIPEKLKKQLAEVVNTTLLPSQSDVAPLRITGMLAKIALRTSIINNALGVPIVIIIG